jgi:diguanylate cyclase (GGDEF)-like protein
VFLTSLPDAITRRRWLISPLAAQAWTIFLLLTDHTVTAAAVASSGIAWMAVLLATADNRVHQACDERDAAHTRASDLEAELAEADTDPVTGLPVRRLAEQHLTHAVGVELTVAVADVDDLHEINNRHGHQLGDDYLAGIAHRLNQIAVDGDLLARLGGDEFVLITTRTPIAVAHAVAAATRHPLAINETQIPVQLSTGICRVPGGNAHLGLGRADLAMYTAKRRGSGIEHYDPQRDGVPQPRGIRPAVRPRDRRRSTCTPGGSA